MNRYEPSALLKQSVEKGDATFVRKVLESILNNNTYPDREIRDALAWAAAQMPRLFTEHKPAVEPLRNESSAWDADYYYAQKAALWDDFSRERFEHLVALRDCLRARGVPEFRRGEAGQNQQGQPASGGAERQEGEPGQAQGSKSHSQAGLAVAVIGVLAVCVWIAIKLISKRVP